MSKEELLASLRASLTTPEKTLLESVPEAVPEVTVERTNPYALQHDAWTIRKGKEFTEQPESRLDPAEGADFWGMFFNAEAKLTGHCRNAIRENYIKEALTTSEYRSLHQSTFLNEASTEIAATFMGERFLALQEDNPDPDDIETTVAASEGLRKASKEVEEFHEACAGLGAGAVGGSFSAQEAIELFKRVRENPIVRRVCQLAGRYRRVAQAKQRMKTTHGQDEIAGTTLAGEITRLLPSEMARFLDESLELDLLKRLQERAAFCREMKAVEPVGKGPILIVLDESGSMEGPKIENAKAIALSMAWIARHQKRWCGLIAYSGNSGERLLNLSPRGGSQDELHLLEWLSKFIGRGSSLDVPVRELPDYYQRIGAPPGKTDVVIITDAICHIPQALVTTFNVWKKAVQAKVTTLVIQDEPGDLVKISDDVYKVPCLSESEESIHKVLSI